MNYDQNKYFMKEVFFYERTRDTTKAEANYVLVWRKRKQSSTRLLVLT